MNTTTDNLDEAVKTKSTAFGNYIDFQRDLFDAPQLSLVQVDLPEYASSGLDRVLLNVMRYQFLDLGNVFGVEGMSVGADSSRGIMVYQDMQSEVVASSHSELHQRNPELARRLGARGYLREGGSKVVLRFAYSYDENDYNKGKGDASWRWTEKHLNQLALIIKENAEIGRAHV